MGVESSDAIILEVVDLQEYDRIVVFLTPTTGKKRGVANGSRRKHSRFAGQLQPLARVQATWFEKENRELVRISGVEIVRSAVVLQSTLEGILLGAYIADQMNAFAQENEDSELLFRLLDSTLAALEAGVDQDLAARYFEAWILRLGGLMGLSEECPACGRLFGDPGESGEPLGAALPPTDETLLCRECAGPGGKAVSQEILAFYRLISTKSLRKVAGFPPSAQALRQMEEIHGRIRRSFLQHELKSYRVMRETLAGLPGDTLRA